MTGKLIKQYILLLEHYQKVIKIMLKTLFFVYLQLMIHGLK
jgi:hypothetical protein